MSDIMTKKEVSEFLKMPIRAIDHLTVTNQLPYSRIGKKSIRFSKERLVEWFRERENIELRYNKS